MNNAITVETQGRRHYIRGNTFPIKDRLRAAGCKWDSDAKAWWTGKLETAVELVQGTCGQPANDAPPTTPAPDSDRGADRAAPGESAIVAARVTYQGRTYYALGRLVRGRTRWDDTVEAVSTRDHQKVLISFRDGSKSFWAARDEVQVVKSYGRPTTIGKLKRFAEEAKQARADGNDDGIPSGRSYECEECGERVTRGQGSCWETGAPH